MAAFGGTAEAGGVAAQAEDLGDGEVVGHRSVEGIEDGEAEGDDLGDVEEIDVFAGGVGFDGLGGGHAGVLDVAAGGGEEHRCQVSNDEVHEHLGGVLRGVVGLWVRHVPPGG